MGSKQYEVVDHINFELLNGLFVRRSDYYGVAFRLQRLKSFWVKIDFSDLSVRSENILKRGFFKTEKNSQKLPNELQNNFEKSRIRLA